MARPSLSRSLWIKRRRHPVEKIKVLIADDHRVVREGLAAILKMKDDIHIVGEAQDGMEAIEKVKTLVPDVVLMDVSMPRMGGVEATRQIKREFPHIRSEEHTSELQSQFHLVCRFLLEKTELSVTMAPLMSHHLLEKSMVTSASTSPQSLSSGSRPDSEFSVFSSTRSLLVCSFFRSLLH